MIFYLNGSYVEEGDVSLDYDDSGFLMGFGLYETMSTYKGKGILINEHVDRFFEGSVQLNIQPPHSKEEIIGILNQVVFRNFSLVDLRIRMTMTNKGYNPHTGISEGVNFIISVSELACIQKESVRVVTFEGGRFLPQVKSTSMIVSLMAKKHANGHKVYESIMHSNGNVLEAAFANVFIIKNDVLITPDSGILKGVTRAKIIECADIDTEIRDVTLEELFEADEVFLTNSTQGVIEVSHIDGRIVGSSANKQYTQNIKKAYAQFLESEL